MDGLALDLCLQQELDALEQSKRTCQLAVVEVCCAEFSSFRNACEYSRIPYIGIMSGMQTSGTFSKVRQCVREWKQRGLWVHVHASIPCTGGSPLNNFRSDPSVMTAAQQEWPELIHAVSRYLNLGDDASFELPLHNSNWTKPETQKMITDCQLRFQTSVRLRRFGVTSRSQTLVGKELRFQCFSQAFATYLSKFSTCDHMEHAVLSDIAYTATGFYNEKLARTLVDAVRYARKLALSEATQQRGSRS